MGTDLKIRLLKLGKAQTDLLHELHRRGFPNLVYALLNDYVNGKRKGAQMEAVLKETEVILRDWEKKENRIA